jgi:hypothetical protein
MASVQELKGRVVALQIELKGTVFNNGDAKAKTREFEILKDRLDRKMTKQNGQNADGNGQNAQKGSYWNTFYPLK